MKSTNDNLFVVVAIVVTFAVGMATFLNYYKFNSLVGRLMHSRVTVIGNEIQDNVEKGLALGLSLQENNTLQGLIERELRSDELLKAITIFDDAGTVLYSTESVQQGKTVAKSWLKAASSSGFENWKISDRSSLVAGLPIRNNFGVTLGHVALSYTRKPLEHCMGIVGNVLLQTALVVLMVTVSAAFALLVFAFRGYCRELTIAEDHLASLIRDLDGQVQPSLPPLNPATDGSFLGVLGGFIATVRSTVAGIDAASDALKTGPHSS